MDAGGPSFGFRLLLGLREHETCCRSVSVSSNPCHSAQQKGSDPRSKSHLPSVERLLERLFVRKRRVGLFQFGELDVHVLCVSCKYPYRLSTAHGAAKTAEVALHKKGEGATHGIVGRGFALFRPVDVDSSLCQLVHRLIDLNVRHHSRRLSFDGLGNCREEEGDQRSLPPGAACTVCAPLFFLTVESLRGMSSVSEGARGGRRRCRKLSC